MSGSSRRALPALVIAVTLGFGILIGTVVSHGVRAAKDPVRAADAQPLAIPSPAELSNSFSQVADKVQDSVVNISTETIVRVAHRGPHSPENAPFEDFFDHFFQGTPEGSPGLGGEGDFRQESRGSGVLLDKNGYILTNFHVITRASNEREDQEDTNEKLVDRITVYLHGDDNKYKARVVGFDRWTDLAVIRVDAGKPLQAADLGDSDSMRVGDWVLAVGSPFGLNFTVTAGIVSAKGRDLDEGKIGQFKRFIQTDAAINPGNSGGPLVNLAAQVIGINTAIATRHGGSDGVGFAIPSNTARKVYNSIITSGSIKRGAIGVQFPAQTNPVLLRSFGTGHGIVVQDVTPGSPAERAGLKRDDVLLSVNGQAVHNGDDLVAIVSGTDIGKRLHIEYLRDGKSGSVEVEVADRDQIIGETQKGLEGDEKAEASPQDGGILGMTVKNLTPEQAQEVASQLHLDAREGVLVADAPVGGFASDVGVERGDVILSINRKPLASLEDYNKLQAQLKSGADVVLLVARRNGRSFATLYLADPLP